MKCKRVLTLLVFVLLMLTIFSNVSSLSIKKFDKEIDTDPNLVGNTVLTGYRVDNLEKIGTIGDFSKTLAENNNLGVEITSKRTPTDRFFKNDDGTITAYLSVSPTCYKDKNGVWHDGYPPVIEIFGTLDDDWEGKSNCYGYVYFYRYYDFGVDEVKKMGCKVYDSGSSRILIGQHRNEWSFGVGFLQKYSRGFAQWDISGIPDSIFSVNDVKLSFYVSNEKNGLYHEDGDNLDHRQYADMRIMQIEDVKPSDYNTATYTDPDSDGWESLADLMGDCWDGTIYHAVSRVKRSSPGKKTWSLNAHDHIKHDLENDWFAVGFYDENEDKAKTEFDAGGILLGGEDTPDDAELVLEVTYEFRPGDVALFIEGGTGDDMQKAFHNSSNLYGADMFKEDLGYGSDGVRVLEMPTKSEIRSALADLAEHMHNGNNIFVYLCDHGVGNPRIGDSWWEDHFGPDWFRHEGKFVLNKNDELLSWNDLADLLDEFHGLEKIGGRTGYGTGIIVVESCFSGHFITEASALHKDADGENHIIITSSGSDQVSWSYKNYYCIFSKYFFGQLKNGDSYGQAWQDTDAYIYAWLRTNSRSLDQGDSVKDFVEKTKESFSKNSFAGFLNNICSLIKESLKSNIDQCQQLYTDDDYSLQDIQCPLLSDNGINNHAGTQGPSKVDTLPMNGNGNFAKTVYP